MTSRGEIARISDGRRDRGGDIGANRLYRHQPLANLVFLRQRQDPLLEALKPDFNVVDLRDDISEGLLGHRRQTFVVSSQAHQLVSFRCPLGGDRPQFGKMSAKSIHGSRALADEKVAGSVNHQHALLLFGFDRHKAHSRSLNSLAAGLRVGGIMFVGFDVGSDIASRHQSGVMTELRQLTRPEMRSAASFEADKARRNIGEETQHLASSKLSSENRPAIGVDEMHLEPSFRVSSPIVVIVIAPLPVSSGVLPLGCGDRPSHYLRFPLSLRDVEDLLAERGIAISYETVRRWVNHFGPMIAAHLRKRRPKPHPTWHLDEVYLKIDGRMVYLWRAVDAEGEVLDVLVQSKRNKHAAPKLMRKLLKKYAFAPERLVTDDLRSYAPAARDLGIEHLHERGRWRNTRAENSHRPTRRGERKMQRFKSAGSAQSFLSAHAAVYNTFHFPLSTFNVQCHLTSAQTHRVLVPRR
jgi:putative transposase